MTLPKPTAFARISRSAAFCSKTARKARVGSVPELVILQFKVLVNSRRVSNTSSGRSLERLTAVQRSLNPQRLNCHGTDTIQSMPVVPHIKTPLPGPKAKALIERDGTVVSPSYTRSYPFVMARGSGATVEDVDGNRLPRLRGRDRRQLHRPFASRRRRGDRRSGAEVPAHVGHRLLLRTASAAW